MALKAMAAMQDTKNRLVVESAKEAYRFTELSREYSNEEKQFRAYLAQRESDPSKLKPCLKPSSETSSSTAIEGDQF